MFSDVHRQARIITLSFICLSTIVSFFLGLTPTDLLIYLPLIINVSLVIPYTGPLMESAANLGGVPI
jgi:hypothetical protein